MVERKDEFIGFPLYYSYVHSSTRDPVLRHHGRAVKARGILNRHQRRHLRVGSLWSSPGVLAHRSSILPQPVRFRRVSQTRDAKGDGEARMFTSGLVTKGPERPRPRHLLPRARERNRFIHEKQLISGRSAAAEPR